MKESDYISVSMYPWEVEVIERTAEGHGVSPSRLVLAALEGNPYSLGRYPLGEAAGERDLYLSNALKPALTAAARSAGETVSSYVRTLIFGDDAVLGRKPVKQIVRARFRPWQYEVLTRTAEQRGVTRAHVVRAAVLGNPYDLGEFTEGETKDWCHLEVRLTKDQNDAIAAAADGLGFLPVDYWQFLLFGTSPARSSKAEHSGTSAQGIAGQVERPRKEAKLIIHCSFRIWQYEAIEQASQRYGVSVSDIVRAVMQDKPYNLGRFTVWKEWGRRRIAVSATRAEAEALTKKAKDSGLSVTNYIRSLMFGKFAQLEAKQETSVTLTAGELTLLKQASLDTKMSVSKVILNILTGQFDPMPIPCESDTEYIPKSITVPVTFLQSLRMEAVSENVSLSQLIRSRTFTTAYHPIPLLERTS